MGVALGPGQLSSLHFLLNFVVISGEGMQMKGEAMLGSYAFFPRGRSVGSLVGECVRTPWWFCPPPDKLFLLVGSLENYLASRHDSTWHTAGAQCIHVTGH